MTNDKKLNEYEKMIAAMQIFLKYTDETDNTYISAEHDEIYTGPDAEKVSAEDIERLDELGWIPNENGCFLHFT